MNGLFSILTLERFIPSGWMTKIAGGLVTLIGFGQLASTLLPVVLAADLAVFDAAAAKTALLTIGAGMAVVGGRRALETLR